MQYKLKLKDGLSRGTPISNTAYIYFDFNAPVVTNTVTNTYCIANTCSPVKGLSPREIGLTRFINLITVKPFLPKDVIFSVHKASEENITALEAQRAMQPAVQSWIYNHRLMLQADINHNTPSDLQVFSSLGQEVYSQKVLIHTGLNEYALPKRLSPGIYLVVLQNEGMNAVQRVVVTGRE